VNVNNARAGGLSRAATVRLSAVFISLLTAAGALWAGTAHAAASPAVQVDAGGAGDATFVADSYFTGGVADANHTGSSGNPNSLRTVAHPIPQTEWNTYRFLESTYTVNGLAPGYSYEVRLYFLDWYWTKVGQRVFGVDINGAAALRDFDIIKASVDAGGDGRYLGVERDFTATADSTGTVTISFLRGSADQPLVNAIALVPTGA
jgi:hypothetical protein